MHTTIAEYDGLICSKPLDMRSDPTIESMLRLSAQSTALRHYVHPETSLFCSSPIILFAAVSPAAAPRWRRHNSRLWRLSQSLAYHSCSQSRPQFSSPPHFSYSLTFRSKRLHFHSYSSLLNFLHISFSSIGISCIRNEFRCVAF